MNSITTITLVIIAIFLINIFFVYWRANTRRLTAKWVLAIHIPVPIAIGPRLGLLGWNWLMLPAFLVIYAAGQYGGGKIRDLLKQRTASLTSFLITDLYRVLTIRSNKKVPTP